MGSYNLPTGCVVLRYCNNSCLRLTGIKWRKGSIGMETPERILLTEKEVDDALAPVLLNSSFHME